MAKFAPVKELLAAKRIPLLVGLVAGFMAVILLQRERAEWQAQSGAGPQKEILVVTRDVAANEIVQAAWMQARPVPAAYVHPLSIGSSDKEVVAGVAAAHPLKADQPLLWSDLVDIRAQDNEMADIVRPNERAVSLRVNEVSGVGRMIRNNDHVDILGTFDRPSGEVVTVPILQNVVVVATGQTLHGAGNVDYATISVSVSPQEAALLTLAQETGRLTYVLRNNHDWDTVPDLQRVSLDDLFEDARRKAVQDTHNIRIVRGKL
jgi:pilus assembly protein CpaB